MATGFRKYKENKKKVVAKVINFPDFDFQYLGKRMSIQIIFSVPESVDYVHAKKATQMNTRFTILFGGLSNNKKKKKKKIGRYNNSPSPDGTD